MGDYLLFVDSDDYLSPDALGSILAALDGSFDICIFDILSVNESGKVLKKMPGTARPDGSVFSLNEYPELLFELPAAWNKIYRRHRDTLPRPRVVRGSAHDDEALHRREAHKICEPELV